MLATAKAAYDTVFDKQIKKGMDKYGVVLSTFNGRDAGQDAVEELVDLSVYLTQLRMEHQAYREILACILFDNPKIHLPEKILDCIFVAKPYENMDYLKRKWGL